MDTKIQTQTCPTSCRCLDPVESVCSLAAGNYWDAPCPMENGNARTALARLGKDGGRVGLKFWLRQN